MAQGPPARIGLIPCGKAFRRADSKYFLNVIKGRANRVPEVRDSSPCSSVLIIEIGAGAKKTANYVDVSKPEGNIERAPKCAYMSVVWN